jgi:hypothetical protein
VISTETASSLSQEDSVITSLAPATASQHTGFFLLVSCVLSALAASGFLPIKHTTTRLIFILALTVCSGMALYGISFSEPIPLLLFHEKFVILNTFLTYFNWLHCLVLALLGTSTVLHLAASTSKRSSGVIAIFIAFSAMPLLSILTTLILDHSGSHQGVAMSSAIACALLAFSVSAVTLVFRSGQAKNLNASMVCTFSAMLCIGWTAVLAMCSTHLSSDVIIPLAALTLLTVPRGHLIRDTPPMATVLLTCAAWWTFSAVYAVTIKGCMDPVGIETIVKPIPYVDANIGFWNQRSFWIPLMNLVLTLLPLPSLFTSFARRRGESEDLVFMLAVFSSISIFGGQVWSIRLLGLAGVVYGLWWCYDLSILQQKSNAML